MPDADDPFLAPPADTLLPEIDHSTFLADEFNVDRFLLSRRHTSLDDLRSELRQYLARLRTELVGVINADYEDFIGLGVGLRGTDERISRIVLPVEGLKEQVDSLRNGLLAIQTAVQNKLETRNSISAQKATLSLLLSVYESVAKVESFLLINATEHTANGNGDETPSQRVNGDRKVLEFSKLPSTQEKPNAGPRSHGLSQRIERIAAEYNQLLYFVQKAQGNKCLEPLQPRIEKITTKLNENLKQLLIQNIRIISDRRNHEDDDRIKRDSLLECFRTYEMLGKVRDAEEIVRSELVRPWVDTHIHRDALAGAQTPTLPQTPFMNTPFDFNTNASTTNGTPSQAAANGFTTPSHPITAYQVDLIPTPTDYQDPLIELYNKILTFVSKECAPILDLTERKLASNTADGPPRQVVQAERLSQGYHILANVILDEVLSRLASDLGHVIFAAGRPDIFHHNYTITYSFLEKLESLCPSSHYLGFLRNHSTYIAFTRRWQLPVYFQLRFREIVNRLETALARKDAASINADNATFLLPSTEASHRAVWSCWQKETILHDLIPRFWRLTLQLISRHRTYVNAILQPILSAASKPSAPEKSQSNSRSATPVPSDGNDETTVRQLTVYIADIQRFESAIQDLFSREISPQLPLPYENDSQELSASPEAVLSAELQTTISIIPKLSQHIIAALNRACADPLRSIRPVASQIRAGNRQVGNEPSYFVSAILKPLKDYDAGIGKLLSEERRHVWYVEIISEIAIRYAAVLSEMRKTDDSLKRFRKGRTGFSLFGSKNTEESEKSEEDRVKVQMQADVQAFINDATAMGVSVQDSKELAILQTAE